MQDKTVNPPGTENTADFTPSAKKYEYCGTIFDLYDVWLGDNGVYYYTVLKNGPLDFEKEKNVQ